MLENLSFEFFFEGIRKFHSCMGEKFYTIVVKRIVRGGDDDARLKIVLADEAGNAGSGDDTGEGDGGARLAKSGGEKSGDVRTRFTGVHPDEDIGGAMFALEGIGQGAASGVESGVIQWRSAGDTAHAVGSEEFFGHEKVWTSQCASPKGPVTSE